MKYNTYLKQFEIQIRVAVNDHSYVRMIKMMNINVKI